MKKGWERKRLGDIVDIELGKTPARATPSFWDEKKATNNVWLSIADLLNIEDGVVNDSKEYLSDKGASLCKLVPKGTLLVSFKLTLGRLAFAGRDLYTNEAIAALTLLNERAISKEYLFWYLQFFDWHKAAEGDVKIKGMTLNKAKLKEIVIEFPPLAEQKRIVALLDEAFAGLATAQANAEKNLQNARALFESQLQTVFSKRGEGWVEKPLGQIGKTQTGSTPKTSDQTNYGKFIPFIKPGDFTYNGTLVYENEGLSKKGLDVSRKVMANSVLMVCIGATIGKCGFCDREVTTNQQINSITPISGVSHLFIYYQMLTKDFQHRVRLNAGQATLPIISKSKWSALKVFVPSDIVEQERIAAHLDALSAETQRLAKIYEQKQAALAALKKSLLHQAFSGAL